MKVEELRIGNIVEVSIIINGVRYDTTEKQPNECCVHCHLYDICDDGDYYNQTLCEKFRVAGA